MLVVRADAAAVVTIQAPLLEDLQGQMEVCVPRREYVIVPKLVPEDKVERVAMVVMVVLVSQVPPVIMFIW